MSTQQQKKLRIKTGIILAILTILFRFVLPSILPGAAAVGVLGGLLGGLLIILWWAFFSGAPKAERWSAVILIIVSLLISAQFIDPSISTGMRGMMFPSYALPILSSALVLWALASRYLQNKVRWTLMIITIIIFSGSWILLRSDGISGHSIAEFSWRWSESAEQKLLKEARQASPKTSIKENLPETPAEWPGFRGPGRDGIAHGTEISTDWTTNPPKELWRKPIGPGCSSFAVHGDLLYTQEQRGEEEVVTCYRLSTGEPVWIHGDKARFWDSHAGAGPRSTPTIYKGRVYSFGATGILNVLDARNGEVIWSRNVAESTGTGIPEWGFSSSPLVCADLVIVALAGTPIAFDLASGEQLWMGEYGSNGYSSPHYFEIEGIPQVVLMCDSGAVSMVPEDGTVLWEYHWPHTDRILQPAQCPNGDILLSTGGGLGMKRLKVSRDSNTWTIREEMSAVQLKSFFNDFVIHGNFAFGFSGPFVECVDILEGGRKWKSGRYGGQLILLADQEALLVLTEKGEVALLSADPEKFMEIGRIPAIEGKTWNHPVVVGDVVLLRNSQEMLAFKI